MQIYTVHIYMYIKMFSNPLEGQGLSNYEPTQGSQRDNINSELMVSQKRVCRKTTGAIIRRRGSAESAEGEMQHISPFRHLQIRIP